MNAESLAEYRVGITLLSKRIDIAMYLNLEIYTL